MKKIFSYILIIIVIFVNLFAPFSVRENGVFINKASADYKYTLQIVPTTGDTYVSIKEKIVDGNATDAVSEGVITLLTNLEIVSTIYDKDNEEVDSKTEGFAEQFKDTTVLFEDLSSNTDYNVKIVLNEKIQTQTVLGNYGGTSTTTTRKQLDIKEFTVHTQNTGADEVVGQSVYINGSSNTLNTQNQSDTTMPACSFTGGILGTGSFSGCIAQAIYYVIFVPTSYFFALSGVFFDYAFSFSVQDTSYRSPFVVEGWAFVRDFCNLFFIFILLYTAISTILSLHHGPKAKDVVVRIIVIGLFINFSLFITQFIVDASNVTARIFYNADTIKITKEGQSDNTLANATDGGTVVAEENSDGVISLSEGLVNKINPQNLILSAQKIQNTKTKTSAVDFSNTTDSESINAGTFIVVTLLATAVNIVGFIVFLSVGLIFVSRIVGLWIAMILSPLAFFTYVIPKWETVDTIGWSNWWNNLLKLSFLAPIFIFFMYLILKFLEINLWADINGSSGIAFVIATILPFVFIMVLLMKAKGIATKMSGEMGQKITGGIAALGGAALGGAALGTAFLGRKTIGSVAKYVQNDGARDKDLKFTGVKDQWNNMNKFNPFSYMKLAGKAVAGTGKAAAAGTAALIHKIPTTQTDLAGNNISFGKKMQNAEKTFREKGHAGHVLDEKAQEITHDKNTLYKDLTEPQKQQVKLAIDKDELSKLLNGGATFDKLTTNDKRIIQDMIDNGDRAVEYTDATGNIKKGVSKTGPAGNNIVEDKNGNFIANFDHDIHHKMSEVMEHHSKAAGAALGEFSTALRRGSFDLRNLSKLTTSSKGMTKAGIGLVSTIALGVRTGLKSSGVNHGTGQKDFIKDITTTITDALKSVKVEVPKSSGGGGHGDGGHDAHGGGGHGGGGHH